MTMRLFLAQPTTIFAARVNQSLINYPIAEVIFDTVGTGAYGDLVAGMTVLFGSSAGADDYGRQRVRKAATSTVLYFGRSSEGTRDGEVDLADDAYITVLNDYRVWSKIPYIDPAGVIYKDNDIAVGTNTTTPPPVANAGAAMAGTIDSGTSKLRVTLPHEANSSFPVAGTISSYAWVLPAGVALVGGYALTDSQIEVDCDAGFYWIQLTVTDSNAETHTVHLPVYARDPASDTSIGTFTIENHRIAPEGQRLSVRILEDIAESTYPDGTLVMLWESEPSTGADRSQMVFIGWHQTDPATIAAERTGIVRDTVFNCLDVAGRLDTLPGFSGSVEVASAPASWTQMTAPNMDKYLHYLLHWHSTALEVADWSWSGTTTTYPFVVLGNAAESLWDQAMRRAKALVPDYILGCNTLGQMQTVIDPLLQDTGDRTVTVQATLQEADWQTVRYTHERPPRAHWLRGEAIVASGSTISAIFCITPGDSPGQGETPISQGEQLAVSQATLNACEGHRYARHNAPERYFSISLAEGADQGIEPSDMTWLRLNVSAATAAQRGLTFSNERGLVREINIRYDHGRTGLVKQVELLWERETSGTAAVTVLLTLDSGLPTSEWSPPDLSYNPVPELDPYTIYDQFPIGTDNGVAYATTDDVINEPTFSWTAFNTGLISADSKEISDLVYVQSLLALYACTKDGLYETSLPLSASSIWQASVTEAEAIAVIGAGTECYFQGMCVSWLDPLRQWCVVAVVVSGTYQNYVLRTTNRWSSFAASAMPYSALPQDTERAGSIDIARHSNDQVLWATGNDEVFNGALYKSIDGGVTWAVHNSSGGWHRKYVCVPDGSETDLYVVYCGADPDTVYSSVNGGVSFAVDATKDHPQHVHYRQRTIAMYLAHWADIEQWDSDTEEFKTWFPGGLTSSIAGGRLVAYDAMCVGWGTDNALGFVIGAGESIINEIQVMHYSDYGDARDITNNLNTALTATAALVIGREGGLWNE